jgi:hypothetical protein
MASKLKTSTLKQLEMYILLVYFSLKQAYLVDCCMLSPHEAKDAINSVLMKHLLERDALAVIVIEADVVIVNKASLVDIADTSTLPIVVTISNQSHTVLLPASDVRDIIQELCSTVLNDSLDPGSHHRMASETASAPLMAGWLLGYPCLYQSTSSLVESSADTSLSMIELLKYSLQADVTVIEINGKDRKQVQRYERVEILGFSIPQDVVNNNKELDSELQCRVDEMAQRLSSRALDMNSKQPIAVTNINVHRSLAVVPSIVL